MPEAPRRPLPVTMACFFVVFGSALLVANLIGLLSQWSSLETRESMTEILQTEPLAGMDIATDDLLAVLEVSLQVVIVLAIAAGVFAVFAARGHEPSRWILSGMLAVAGLMFAASGLAGILPGILAVACVAILWSPDARQWFAATNGRPAVAGTTSGRGPAPDPFATPPSTPQPPQSSTSQSSTTPSTIPAPHQPSVPVPPTSDPTGAVAPRPGQAPPGDESGRRPRAVTVALWVAGATSASVAGLCGVGLLAVLLLGDAFREAFEEPGLVSDYLSSSDVSVDSLLGFMQVSFATFLVLGLVGVAVAAWAASGHPSGRFALVGMSILTLVVSVIATFGFIPFNVPTAAAAIVVLVQLRTPQARAWFTRSTS